MAYSYDYPRPQITVDAVIFNDKNGDLEILLIRRKKDPFRDKWAFPGGFMEIDENPDVAAKRELLEETSLRIDSLIQVGAFGQVDRDPRGRIVSIAYTGFVEKGTDQIAAASDAEEAQWFSVFELPALAFDHRDIYYKTIERLGIFLDVALNQNQPFIGLTKERMRKILTTLKKYELWKL